MLNELFETSKFKCDQCDKTFKSIHGLSSHKNFHDPEFVEKQNANRVISRQAALNSKKTCQFCNEIYTSGNIKKHESSCKLNPENSIHFNNCKQCGTLIYKLIFCNESCAAKFNNKNRSNTSRKKQGQTLRNKRTPEQQAEHDRRNSVTGTGRKHDLVDLPFFIEPSNEFNPILNYRHVYSKFVIKNCSACNCDFIIPDTWNQKGSRNTCSEECARSKSYTRSKHYEYNGVHFQSSWELEIAIFLDENNIKWVRPKYIPWIDSSGKSRKYFPDFYLPDYDLYVDPKNNYCIKQDQEKLNYVSQHVNIIYGSVNFLIDKIKNWSP